MQRWRFSTAMSAVSAIFAVTLLVAGTPAAGQTVKVLHGFNNNGQDGFDPESGLIFDASGNLYGTTVSGGTHYAGTVFELTPEAGGGWSEKILHNFNYGADGQNPNARLILDASGNLYGTTFQGGRYGYGSVFELTPKAAGVWTEKILHSFNHNGSDGYNPYASGLIFDAAGSLYGTTYLGGTNGGGTVFKLLPAWQTLDGDDSA